MSTFIARGACESNAIDVRCVYYTQWLLAQYVVR